MAFPKVVAIGKPLKVAVCTERASINQRSVLSIVNSHAMHLCMYTCPPSGLQAHFTYCSQCPYAMGISGHCLKLTVCTPTNYKMIAALYHLWHQFPLFDQLQLFHVHTRSKCHKVVLAVHAGGEGLAVAGIHRGQCCQLFLCPSTEEVFHPQLPVDSCL